MKFNAPGPARESPFARGVRTWRPVSRHARHGTIAPGRLSILCVYRPGVEDRRLHDFQCAGLIHTPEKARMIALVAGAALLADLDQQHVRIAIDLDRFDNLNVSGRLSLVPQGAARPRVEMGLPDLERFPQGR